MKFDEDQIKNEGAIVFTTFSPLWESIGQFFVAQEKLLSK